MFSVETAIVDEIVKYNKVDCPFVLSSNFSESVKEKVDKNFKDIYNLVKESFKTAQVSDGNEQDFVLELRKRVFYIPSLEFVAEEQGELIGHIMFTKQAVDLEKGKLKALLIAPLCVDLAYRNQGIGSKLMNYGLMKAKELGYDTAFLVGNPEYYQKFGFLCVTNYNLKNMTTIPDKYVMVKEIKEKALSNVKGGVDLH